LLGRLGTDPTDEAAWGAFVSRYGPRVHGWCRQWRLQDADADEVTQVVLVKLAGKMRTFAYDGQRSFRGWLRLLTQHALSDFLACRKRGPVASGSSDVLDCLHSIEARDSLTERLEAEFDLELLEEAMRRVRLRVAPDKWEVFRRTALEGEAGQDVARAVGMKVATVFVVRSKVQKMIREELERLDEDVA
jgi:RNA polymerase sigma factor (sigma-70 family)